MQNQFRYNFFFICNIITLGVIALYLTTYSNTWSNRFCWLDQEGSWTREVCGFVLSVLTSAILGEERLPCLLPPQLHLHPSTRLLPLLQVLHTEWKLPILFTASSQESFLSEIWKYWLADDNCHYPHQNWASGSFLIEQLGVLLSLHFPLIWI